jgi:hypothetical protein
MAGMNVTVLKNTIKPRLLAKTSLMCYAKRQVNRRINADRPSMFHKYSLNTTFSSFFDDKLWQKEFPGLILRPGMEPSYSQFLLALLPLIKTILNGKTDVNKNR